MRKFMIPVVAGLLLITFASSAFAECRKAVKDTKDQKAACCQCCCCNCAK